MVFLVVKFAKENPAWVYDRIQGALDNVGDHICAAFLKAHWNVLAAIDFTTVEVWTKGGLVTFYLLFAMELKTHSMVYH